MKNHETTILWTEMRDLKSFRLQQRGGGEEKERRQIMLASA
jgi:hypothetical protein